MVMKRFKEMFGKVGDAFAGKPEDGKAGNSASSKRTDLVKIEVKSAEKEPLSLEVVKLQNFSETENILDSLRSGKKILLVKISGLKEKDMTELKRAINRFKTHCAATGSDLAAIDESWIILVPPVVGLERV